MTTIGIQTDAESRTSAPPSVWRRGLAAGLVAAVAAEGYGALARALPSTKGFRPSSQGRIAA
jgi:hypothetical protein